MISYFRSIFFLILYIMRCNDKSILSDKKLFAIWIYQRVGAVCEIRKPPLSCPVFSNWWMISASDYINNENISTWYRNMLFITLLRTFHSLFLCVWEHVRLRTVSIRQSRSLSLPSLTISPICTRIFLYDSLSHCPFPSGPIYDCYVEEDHKDGDY